MKKKQFVYELINPLLDNYHVVLNEALFHNANGYIGVRYDFEEGYPDSYDFMRSQYINGFYDYSEMPQAEKLYGLVEEKQTMLDVANTQTIRLFLGDGEEFSMFSGTVLSSRLSLDMEKGVTVRDVLWRSPKGKELHLTVTRMASFSQLPLFLIEYEVEPLNFSGNIVIESAHEGNVSNYGDPKDPRNADMCMRYITPVNCEIINGASYITSKTEKSGLTVCSCVKNILSQSCQREFSMSDNQAVCSLKTVAKRRKKIRLLKYAIFCDSIRYDDCKSQAVIELGKALSVPAELHYRKQEEYLKDYWKNCCVGIDGDDELAQALVFNMYQLIQSVSKDQYGNIAPKGLSGEGYEGHFFWDSEMYIQPFFTITNPAISKILIESRYAALDLARENARILGHGKGALYPWRTITGRECSGYFPAGSAQYHINGDIAYAIVAYYLATKDLAFIEEKGAEIIFETARLWMDTGNFYEGKFVINDVTGPDEYTCIVNNNYYTNVLAQYHLRWAVKFYALLKHSARFIALTEKLDLKGEEIEGFQRAAENMYLPYDKKLKINPQDDSFLQKEKWDISGIPRDHFPLLLHYHPLYIYRHQICKQADTVMAHFILEDAQSDETMRNSFLYYEKVTTHDSSLSEPIFSIVAARLGFEEKAYAYFGNSAKLDLTDLCRNTRDGIHTANMGGSFMTMVYGFGGFRLKEQGISFAPMLPEQWTEYRFKIVFEDSSIMVYVRKKECVFILGRGSAKKIKVYGKDHLLESKIIVDRPLSVFSRS